MAKRVLYSESRALKALSDIRDPKTGRNIIDAGMLADIAFKDGVVRAVLTIDPADAEIYSTLQMSAQSALQTLAGVDVAQVILTAHTKGPTLKAPPTKGVRPHRARRSEGYQGDSRVTHIIAVSSAKGGVGKSTIAVNLAVAMAKRGVSTGVLDADIHGPSVPILLGLKGQSAQSVKRHDRTLISPFSAYGVKAMSIGFLTQDDGPIVWRGPLVQGAISKMLWDVDWGELEYLFIDMPPGTGDAQLGLAQDIKPVGAIIVSTPQDLALADARKGVAMFKKVEIEVLGLVENMGMFICPSCGDTHHIFGQNGARLEAEALNIPFLGSAPLDMAIRQSGDKGEPISFGAAPAGQFFDDLSKKVETLMAEVMAGKSRAE